MKKQNLLLINVDPPYIRIAQIQNNVLTNFSIENLSSPSKVGSIYKAQVIKKQKGLEACFLELENEMPAFLYTGKKNEATTITSGKNPQELQNNQMLMVQIIKDPLKKKSYRVSNKISVPGLFLVYLPNSPFYIGVSKQIKEKEKRKELSQCIQELSNSESCIIRTKTSKAKKEQLQKEWFYLKSQWENILKKYSSKKTPGLIWSDVSLPFQILRDLIEDETDEIIVDDEKLFSELIEWKESIGITNKASLYKNKKTSLFDKHKINWEKLLRKKVRLKSGGFIVIEETEAAVVIDVNTGRFMGKKSLEENILKINLEAAKEIISQIRLRNCGGIILIDFIDMEKIFSRLKVMETLSNEIQKDRAPIKLYPMSELGIVSITRKRNRGSLLEKTYQTCPHCKNKFYLSSK